MRKITRFIDKHIIVLSAVMWAAILCPDLFRYLLECTVALVGSACNTTISLPWPPNFLADFAHAMLLILELGAGIGFLSAIAYFIWKRKELIQPRGRRPKRTSFSSIEAMRNIEEPNPVYGPAPEILRKPLDRIWRASKSFEPDRGREVLQTICRKVSELFAQPHRPHSVPSQENYSIKLIGMVELIELMKPAASRPNCAESFDATLADLQTFVEQIEQDIAAADGALAGPLEIRRKMLLERPYPDLIL